MMRAHNLNLSLGGQSVLKDVTLSAMPGRVTVLLGPNGAGKSSLMRSLAGLLPCEQVFLGDRPLSTLSLRERAQHIGYLPQNGAPAWNISARELVGLGRLPYRSALTVETEFDKARAEAALIATDTLHLADRTVGTLSGGELARVKLARLFAGEHDWLLADEPLANLDPLHQREILNLLRAATVTGKGVIIVLHQLDAALHIADDMVLLKNGEVLASGPANACMTQENLEQLYDTGFELIETSLKRTLTQIW
jgi:iron complex transport system ATP-binding protein